MALQTHSGAETKGGVMTTSSFLDIINEKQRRHWHHLSSVYSATPSNFCKSS